MTAPFSFFSLFHRHGSARFQQAQKILEDRRRTALLRSLGIALIASLTLGGMANLLTPEQSVTAVVTIRQVSSGQRIKPSDVALCQLNPQTPRAGLAHGTSDVVGRYATHDLPANSLVALNFLDAAEPLPQGYTVISLPLSSDASTFHRGSTITLFTSSVQSEDTAGGAEASSLSVPAIVMESGTNDETRRSTDSIGAATPVLVGVEAQQAERLIRLAQSTPFFAVERSD